MIRRLRRTLRWWLWRSKRRDHERRITRLEDSMREITKAFNRRGTQKFVDEFKKGG
jgi:hypothetical protein